MGVSGEHEADVRTSAVCDDVVGVVGRVDHEDDGPWGPGRDGKVEVGDVGSRVCGATDDQVVSAAGEDDEAVAKNGDAVSFEGVGDERGTDGDVMVAEAGVALGAGEGLEDLGTAACGVVCGDKGEGAAGDEVSGEQDEVRVEVVDAADHVFEEVGFGVFVDVDVAELGDAQALKGGREAGENDGVLCGVDLVASDLAGVDGETGGEGSGAGEKGAA